MVSEDKAPPAMLRNLDFTSAPKAEEPGDGLGPVVVVDDDDWVCDSLSVLLHAYGFCVHTFGSGAQFLADGARAKAKCLVIDQHMPGLDGLEVVAELRRQGIPVPTILITGRVDPGTIQRATALGVLATLEKPFAVAGLVEVVRRALEPPGRPEPVRQPDRACPVAGAFTGTDLLHERTADDQDDPRHRR